MLVFVVFNYFVLFLSHSFTIVYQKVKNKEKTTHFLFAFYCSTFKFCFCFCFFYMHIITVYQFFLHKTYTTIHTHVNWKAKKTIWPVAVFCNLLYSLCGLLVCLCMHCVYAEVIIYAYITHSYIQVLKL